MSFLSKDVGVDLGTANTLVYMKGKGIIMREPSVVAVDTKTDEVRCVGAEAKAVIGRTPGSIVAVRPLKDGVIADFDITANMLENFLKKACGNSMFSRPRVVICIPSGVTEVERRAVREAALKAGAGKLLIGHFSSRYPDVEVLVNEARNIFPATEAVVEGESYDIRPVMYGAQEQAAQDSAE